MVRIWLYLILIGLACYFIYRFFDPRSLSEKIKSPGRFLKPHPKDSWVQVYETDSWEEARLIQTRLLDEKIESIVYEQGKKDIHGQPLRGIGIAVPKSVMSFAQKIISRIPV
jgi:hypothetical protein